MKQIVKKLLLFCILAMMTVLPASANRKVDVIFSECVDGDTAHFYIDGEDRKVRFLAINAPEYTTSIEPYGKEASEYVCKILENAEKLQLEYDDGSDEEDKYGRILAWVYADGELVQKKVVAQGLAEVKYIYGDYAYTEELEELQKQAQVQKLNMWSDEDPSDREASEEPAENDGNALYGYFGAAGGVILIMIGLFATKNKSKRQHLIHQGVKQIKNSRRKK